MAAGAALQPAQAAARRAARGGVARGVKEALKENTAVRVAPLRLASAGGGGAPRGRRERGRAHGPTPNSRCLLVSQGEQKWRGETAGDGAATAVDAQMIWSRTSRRPRRVFSRRGVGLKTSNEELKSINEDCA